MKKIKHYDETTKELTLVTKVIDPIKGEVETETYQYPMYVKGFYTKRAIDLGAELEESEYVVSSELFDRLTNFFVELYGKQFTKEQFVDGVDQGQIVNVFITMLFGVLQGDPKNE